MWRCWKLIIMISVLLSIISIMHHLAETLVCSLDKANKVRVRVKISRGHDDITAHQIKKYTAEAKRVFLPTPSHFSQPSSPYLTLARVSSSPLSRSPLRSQSARPDPYSAGVTLRLLAPPKLFGLHFVYTFLPLPTCWDALEKSA